MRHWIGRLGTVLLLTLSIGAAGCGDPNDAGLGASCNTVCMARSEGGCLPTNVDGCYDLCMTYGLGTSVCSDAAQYLNNCRAETGTACTISEDTGDPCVDEQAVFEVNCGLGAPE